MMNLNHENLVKYENMFVHKNNIVIEMEHCRCSLYNLINSLTKPFHVGQIKKIVFSIAEGIKYLHSNDIIHRDVKPGNVLIDEGGCVKISDFGSCRIISQNSSTKTPFTPQIGTKWYKAPEIIFGKKDYDKYVDIWSFGCLIAELFLMEPIFPGNTDFEMISYICNILGFSDEDNELLKPKIEIDRNDKNLLDSNLIDLADEDAIDLIKKMLVVNYNKRISIDEVLDHKFLKNYDYYKNINFP
jgi:serine/threonine protein kinase